MISAGPSEWSLIGSLAERTDRAEFVGHAQHHARRIGSVGNKFRIIRQHRKFLIDAAAGVASSRSLACRRCSRRCADRPNCARALSRSATNGAILQMLESLRSGSSSASNSMHLLAVYILEVLAVRAHQRLREADDSSLARPVERRLQHDLFVRVALRFVKARGGFRLAENIGDAVVADAVARAEIRVGVVVEGAPADAAGVLRIRRELIVNARMAQRVFAQTLDRYRSSWSG